MSSSTEDIYTIALDLLAASTGAPSEPAARERAQKIASVRSGDDMRRVSCLLAVLCGRTLLPVEVRRKFPARIERLRFEVLAYSADPDSGFDA